MEKHTPHYGLSEVKKLLQSGSAHITRSALSSAAGLGFDAKGVLGVVDSLSIHDFYKSMTAINDHRVWQDVYHPVTSVGKVYLKLTVQDGLLVLSFKGL